MAPGFAILPKFAPLSSRRRQRVPVLFSPTKLPSLVSASLRMSAA
jgi:hypothetical protein